jgi:catechol 2,3-dioxygenase-like lactoylglutathione lyase family enzyme
MSMTENHTAPSAEPSALHSLRPKAFAFAIISVTDLKAALTLWQDRFGMEVVTRREGADPGLSKVWSLDAGAILDQALLVTPGMRQGGLHLVQFANPGPTVREGAAPTDLCPKSIDIAVHDIQTRFAELESAGFRFRSKIGRFETDGIVVHEVHLPGPEDVNLVFLEQVGKPEHVSSKGYGVSPQVVATSPDNRLEKQFFEDVLGMDEASYHRFGGPEVERTIGLPPGGQLDVRIFGEIGFDYGRLEIVQYEGVKSTNLYPRAQPPARGFLGVSVYCPDISATLQRAISLRATQDASVSSEPRDHGVIDTIMGHCRMATVHSPAGLRIQLFWPSYQ